MTWINKLLVGIGLKRKAKKESPAIDPYMQVLHPTMIRRTNSGGGCVKKDEPKKSGSSDTYSTPAVNMGDSYPSSLISDTNWDLPSSDTTSDNSSSTDFGGGDFGGGGAGGEW